MRKRIYIETMGCRTNAADSSLLARTLVSSGAEIVPDPSDADWIVLNSCTVTHKADRDAGKFVRRMRRDHPDARVILTGCLPQAQPLHNVASLVDAVVPAFDVARVLSVLGLDKPAALGERFVLERLSGLSRVNVKIGQGCAHSCSYCIVPTARGRPYNRPVAEIIDEVAAAIGEGYSEVVLSATHLMEWQNPEQGSSAHQWALTDLMNRLSIEFSSSPVRFRLGSVEPHPGLASVARLLGDGGPGGMWCPHLHVALQSCSDVILKDMGRYYSFGQVAEWLTDTCGAVSDITIGFDIIVGFPTETDETFRDLYDKLQTLPFSYLHVFMYSPRPGTLAAGLVSSSTPQTLKARSEVLRALGLERRDQQMQRMIGRTLRVVAEQEVEHKPGVLSGLTDNYLGLTFPGNPNLIGRPVWCRVSGVDQTCLAGELVSGASDVNN